MTPGARLAAAAQVLDGVLAGTPAEAALIAWARGSRFAGSGDRAAVRDLVFDALRRRRTAGRAGGSDTGRGLMLGLLRLAGQDAALVMTGQGHALAPPEPSEAGLPSEGASAAEAADMPDWLWPNLSRDLGDSAAKLARALQDRAPLYLRVNLRKSTREAAIAALAADGVEAVAHDSVRTALRVTGGARRVAAAAAYLDGRIEIQDAASQAAVLALPLHNGMTVLDFCAGGGGKTLAMAALADLRLTAHDAAPGRMRDLTPRAARAGARVDMAETAALVGTAFDLVLTDVPCSGSGTWRRSPDAKWRLDATGLQTLCRTQASILRQAAGLVRSGGILAYATCSILDDENESQIKAFLAESAGWSRIGGLQLWPDSQGDGFFLACLRRSISTQG